MEIQNKCTIVAGGASGIGQATALALATQGAKVAILDINKEGLTKTAQRCQGKGFVCDVTSSRAVKEAIEKVIKYFNGHINILINSVGIAPAKRIVSKNGPTSLDFFTSVININLIGTYNVMRLVAGSMCQATPDKEGERGLIINTASIAAFDGQIGQAAYSASKGGVVALTLPAARELAPFGIRVMTIAPGLIDTPLLDDLPEEVKSRLKKKTLFPPRFGKVTEYASLVLEIIQNPMLNAEVIRLDGGLRMT